MIIYVILVLLVLICFMLYFHRKNKKVFKILRVLLVLVIIAVSTLFIFSLSGLIDTGSYDISNVSMRGNKHIEVKVWRVNSEQIKITLTNHDTTIFKYTDYFICSKYKDAQWETMSFSRDAVFAKCVYELESGQSVTRVIRWEDFFGKRLESGKYCLDWIAPLEFKIDRESGFFSVL